MNILLGLVVGLIFFLFTIKAYCLGLKHGKQLVNNEVPKLEPIQSIENMFNMSARKKEIKTMESAIGEYWSD